MKNNWIDTSINQICKIVSGSTPRTSEPLYWGGDIVWVTPMDLSKLKGKYLTKGARNITKAGLRSCSAELVPTNSLVMSSRAPIGYFAINKSQVTTNQGCKSFICNESVDIEFLYYALNQYIDSIKRLGSGSTFAEVGKRQLESLSIKIPNKTVQQKIADILSSLDEAIQKTDQVIQKSEELKNGLMNELLTKGIGHTKFKKTKLGEIPEEWELVQIKQTSQVKGGKRLPKGTSFSAQVTSHPYLRIVDFKNMTVDHTNLKYIDDDTYKLISRYIINCDDVYISIAGTIGIVGLIPKELDRANLTENAAKIVINTGFLKEYLAYFLTSPLGKMQINNLAVKTTQPKLALNKIEEIKVPLPSLREQQEIVRLLSELDQKYIDEKNYKYKLMKIKHGLMHDIFSQKIEIN